MRMNKRFVYGMGWPLLLLAFSMFILQVGYFYLHKKFQIEYIDNRLFYIANIIGIVCLFFAIMILLRFTKKGIWVSVVIMAVFLIVHLILAGKSNEEIKNITSISPDFKHILALKVDKRGETVYYRDLYGIFGRPKETFPHLTKGNFKVEWLTNDIAAITYLTVDESIQQFIATYGDRGGGIAYYYVAAEIQGTWRGGQTEVISHPEGITIIDNGQKEHFSGDQIVQYGTLAVVLEKDNESCWTIALDESFQVHSDASIPVTGEIILYKSTMEKAQPIKLYKID